MISFEREVDRLPSVEASQALTYANEVERRPIDSRKKRGRTVAQSSRDRFVWEAISGLISIG